jgi:hypothetical protein
MRRRAAITAAAVLALVSGCDGPRQQTPPAGVLADRLDDRVAAATSRHEGGTSCRAWTFGVDPASATDIRQVRIAYAWVSCRDPHDGAAELVPAAVTLSGTPAVEIPRDDHFSADLDRIFPADVRAAAAEPPEPARDLGM